MSDLARIGRRRFLQLSGAAAAASVASPIVAQTDRRVRSTHPNILVIICDQLGFDALSAQGCPDVHTPNIDRLMRRGMSFQLAHSPSPVCSPARSSMFTGRMPTETAVVTNSLPIHPSLPTMGSTFRAGGYQTVYCGKWHLPHGYPVAIKGFEVLPVGGGQGDLSDPIASRSCEAFLHSRRESAPFLLVASFLQPHDICYWAIFRDDFIPEELPFGSLRNDLPRLPVNHGIHPKAPERLARSAFPHFSDDQWRYYIYVYYRQVEMLDADVGRLLDALEASGHSDNTVVVFTSDHGEGRGRHSHVQKWYPYEEAVRIPLFISWPGSLPTDVRDRSHLVSHIDILPTLCDLAGIESPPSSVGRSLVPLVTGTSPEWRSYLVSDVQRIGRMVRTDRFKFVVYDKDPVLQLFDMEDDPWETVNLAEQSRFADIVAAHKGLLKEWNGRLTPIQDSDLTFGL